MKAAFITETGAPCQIQYDDLPTPSIDSNQILVKVEAVTVNPIDTYIRSGNVKLELPQQYIIGCDLAGTVEAVGSGTTRFKVGDRVWGSNQGLSGRQGTFAEYAAVDECWLYPTPNEVESETVAAISLTGITAHLGLHLHGELQSGDVVFVNGGTGGVGSVVVQLAKAARATVITTVGSSEKQMIAKELGADFAINYHDGDIAQMIAAVTSETGAINLWFETLRTPNPDITIPLLAKRGRYVLMAGRDARPVFPVGPFYVNDLRAAGFAMFNASAEEQEECAADINRCLSAGKMKALIGARFTLSEAAAAHQLQEDNTLHGAGTLSGKIVLTP